MSLLYDAEQIRAWDYFTIKNEAISSIALMERAALLAAKKILGSYRFKSVSIFCGKGNNGGDGLVIARLFALRGIKTKVYICDFSVESSSDFDENLARLPKSVSVKKITGSDSVSIVADLIVDCIFGSGLNRPIENWVGEVIQIMNQSIAPTVSIDIPSGFFIKDNRLNSLINSVKADLTISFQIPKFCFFFAKYEPYIGRFWVADIGLPSTFKGESIGVYMDKEEVELKPISPFAHKGNKGYLTVIAGNESMLGAALISVEAAFKTGCGYVGLVSNKSILAPLATRTPEAMWIGETPSKVPSKTTAITIGPGLGKTKWSMDLLDLAFSANVPLIIDADAINLIAENQDLLNQVPKNSILTPHIGELYRLIGKFESPETLLEKQIEFSIKHGLFILQKGAYSKLTTPDGSIFINSTGNASMATAGMGDALAGMIGSFLAQGYTPLESVKNGMYFHGKAGDLAAQKLGERGLLTRDVISFFPAVLNAFF